MKIAEPQTMRFRISIRPIYLSLGFSFVVG